MSPAPNWEREVCGRDLKSLTTYWCSAASLSSATSLLVLWDTGSLPRQTCLKSTRFNSVVTEKRPSQWLQRKGRFTIQSGCLAPPLCFVGLFWGRRPPSSACLADQCCHRTRLGGRGGQQCGKRFGTEREYNLQSFMSENLPSFSSLALSLLGSWISIFATPAGAQMSTGGFIPGSTKTWSHGWRKEGIIKVEF